jgi:dTDP-4-amino-4,6-dideoxygalactose transaminase
MHLQPVFQGCRIRGGAVSEDLFAKGLCLPSGTQLTEEDLERIVAVIKGCRMSGIIAPSDLLLELNPVFYSRH